MGYTGIPGVEGIGSSSDAREGDYADNESSSGSTYRTYQNNLSRLRSLVLDIIPQFLLRVSENLENQANEIYEKINQTEKAKRQPTVCLGVFQLRDEEIRVALDSLVEQILSQIKFVDRITEKKGKYTIEKGAVIVPVGEQQLGMVPWLPHAEDNTVTVDESKVAFVFTPGRKSTIWKFPQPTINWCGRCSTNERKVFGGCEPSAT